MGCLLSYPSLAILTRMCRRHQALHSAKSTINACQGCGKTFSRLDALNVSHTPLQPLLCWCAMLIPGCMTRVFNSGTVSFLVRFSASRTDIDTPLPRAVRSEGGSECRQASASPNSALESPISPEGRASSPDAKIERSPTPTLSVTPTDETRSTDGGADSTD
jgi:hypothetical protein